MIVGRITAKAQTTVPIAVRRALGIAPGDDVAWEVEGEQATLRRLAPDDDLLEYPFALFTEWADELDCEAFDKL